MATRQWYSVAARAAFACGYTLRANVADECVTVCAAVPHTVHATQWPLCISLPAVAMGSVGSVQLCSQSTGGRAVRQYRSSVEAKAVASLSLISFSASAITLTACSANPSRTSTNRLPCRR